jgi:stage III sporulation protein AH
MNSKRQTIWLVSMLSLMVVLSAYYLFTEDVSKLDLAAIDAEQGLQEVKIDLSQTDQAVTAAEKGATDTKATDTKAAQAQTKTDAAAPVGKDNTTTSAKNDDADAKVLEKMEAVVTSASDFFTSEGMKRHEELRKKTEQLMTTITDNKQKPETVAQATNDLEKISEIQEKVEGLEELLIKDFNKALITQEGKQWKITVQSDKLERSQGVTIVDLVMKELGAAPENIKIQYVRP